MFYLQIVNINIHVLFYVQLMQSFNYLLSKITQKAEFKIIMYLTQLNNYNFKINFSIFLFDSFFIILYLLIFASIVILYLENLLISEK